MNYYTADLHISYENVIKTANRPFLNILGMNYTIINNINSRVTKKDTLYILGDVSFAGADIDYVCYMLKQISCRIVLITGNHDKCLLKSRKFRNCFSEIHDHLLITDGDYDLFLSHYPHAEWDGYYKGRYHFYAHVHNKKDGGAALINLIPQTINVGMDEHNFMPMTAEEFINWRKQTYQIPDMEAFFNAVLHPEVDFTRSPKAVKFEETASLPNVDYDFDETCPYCDFINNIVWDKKSHSTICQGCGRKILLCNLCDMDNCNCGDCPYETE